MKVHAVWEKSSHLGCVTKQTVKVHACMGAYSWELVSTCTGVYSWGKVTCI
jgi:hypothetical protein